MVEREMRVTLACRLKDAVGDVKQFKDGNVDPQKFIDWCDKYQVSLLTQCLFIRFSAQKGHSIFVFNLTEIGSHQITVEKKNKMLVWYLNIGILQILRTNQIVYSFFNKEGQIIWNSYLKSCHVIGLWNSRDQKAFKNIGKEVCSNCLFAQTSNTTKQKLVT